MHNALLRTCPIVDFYIFRHILKHKPTIIYIQTIYIGQGEGNKTFFSFSLKSAFSSHDNVRANSTWFIWLNENVGLPSSKKHYTKHCTHNVTG